MRLFFMRSTICVSFEKIGIPGILVAAYECYTEKGMNLPICIRFCPYIASLSMTTYGP